MKFQRCNGPVNASHFTGSTQFSAFWASSVQSSLMELGYEQSTPSLTGNVTPASGNLHMPLSTQFAARLPKCRGSDLLPAVERLAVLVADMGAPKPPISVLRSLVSCLSKRGSDNAEPWKVSRLKMSCSWDNLSSLGQQYRGTSTDVSPLGWIAFARTRRVRDVINVIVPRRACHCVILVDSGKPVEANG